MQLADLNGAGFRPVAGSWLLVNDLEPCDPGPRRRLWASRRPGAWHANDKATGRVTTPRRRPCPKHTMAGFPTLGDMMATKPLNLGLM